MEFLFIWMVVVLIAAWLDNFWLTVLFCVAMAAIAVYLDKSDT